MGFDGPHRVLRVRRHTDPGQLGQSGQVDFFARIASSGAADRLMAQNAPAQGRRVTMRSPTRWNTAQRRAVSGGRAVSRPDHQR